MTKPTFGQTYYSIACWHGKFEVYEDVWAESPRSDLARLSEGNVYLRREDAEAALSRVLAALKP